MTSEVQGLIFDCVVVAAMAVLMALKILPTSAGLSVIGSIIGAHTMMRRTPSPMPPTDPGAASGGNVVMMQAAKTVAKTSVVMALGLGLAHLLHRKAA